MVVHPRYDRIDIVDKISHLRSLIAVCRNSLIDSHRKEDGDLAVVIMEFIEPALDEMEEMFEIKEEKD